MCYDKLKFYTVRKTLRSLSFPFTLYVISLSARMFVYLILVILTLNEEVQVTSDVQSKESNQRYIELYRLMRLIGANYRGLRGAGAHSYGLYFLLPMIFYISNKTIMKFMVNFNENSFITFMKSPCLSYARTSKRIEECIRRVIMSNKNFTGSIELYQQMNVEGDTNISEESFRQNMDTLKARRSSLLTFRRINTNARITKQVNSYAQSSSLKRNSNSKTEEVSLVTRKPRISNEVLRDEDDLRVIEKQCEHLMNLLSNYSSLWPVNRSDYWHDKLRHFWLHMYRIFFISVFIGSQISTFLAIYLSYLGLKGNKLLSVEEQQFTLMDRINMIEQSCFCCLGANWFVTPVVTLMTFFKDHLHLLRLLDQRFLNYFRKVKDYRTKEIAINNSNQALNKSHIMNEDFRHRCDCEALELYIYFQTFNLEVKSNNQFIGYIVNQFIIFQLGLLLCNLAVIRSIEFNHLYLLAPLIAMIIVPANIIFYFCAFFNSRCIKTTNMAWSLLAISQTKHQSTLMNHYRHSTTINSFHNEEISCSNHQDSLSSANLLNHHTKLLWHRLIVDQKDITDQLACKALGMVRIEYESMLRFNFWLMSAIMLVLSD